MLLGPVPEPRPPRETALKDLHLISRYFTDLDWLWHTTYIKYDTHMRLEYQYLRFDLALKSICNVFFGSSTT